MKELLSFRFTEVRREKTKCLCELADRGAEDAGVRGREGEERGKARRGGWGNVVDMCGLFIRVAMTESLGRVESCEPKEWMIVIFFRVKVFGLEQTRDGENNTTLSRDTAAARRIFEKQSSAGLPSSLGNLVPTKPV